MLINWLERFIVFEGDDPPKDPPPKDPPKDPPQDPPKDPPGDPPDDKKPVPYDRFKEVNDRLKEATDRIVAIEAKEAERKEKELKDQNKWQDLYEAEKQKNESLQLENVRTQVALAKGLPPEMAARLQGKTQEELEADADQLLPLVRNKTPGVPPGGPGQPKKPLDVAEMTPEEIRKNSAELIKQAQSK